MKNKCPLCGKPIPASLQICKECELSLQQNAEEIEAVKLRRIRLVPELLWEQRRYEIARDMMAAFLSNSCQNVYSGPVDKQAKDAVRYADALIAELKGGKK